MFSIRVRLILAFLVTGLSAVALVGLVAQWRLSNKYNENLRRDSFNEFRMDVAAYYTTYGSWAEGERMEPFPLFVQRRHALQGWHFWERGWGVVPGRDHPSNPAKPLFVPPVPGPVKMPTNAKPPRAPFLFMLLDPSGRVIKGQPPYEAGALVPPDMLRDARPIEAVGRTVALAVPLDTPNLSELDRGYLEAMRDATLYGVAVAAVLGTLLGLLLGTGVTRRLRRLVLAAQALAKGQLGRQVPVAGRDEIGILADEFNRMSRDLARSHDALEQARRVAEEANAAKSSFLAAASHDLRQPLHALGLFVSSLRHRRVGPVADEALDNIEASLASLRASFEGLLDVSRLDAGAIEPRVTVFPLQPLFDSVARDLVPLAERKPLRIRFVSTALWVRSDPALLERMLRNLVSNAVRYTDRGGVAVGCRRQEGQVQIDVWDTGIGIAESEQFRIFGEFYQAANTQGSSEGLGLGLSIVSRLAQLLGHRLHVQSVPGKGSRFSVAVERAAPAAAQPVVEPGLPIQQGFNGALALVVDDEAAIRAGMATLLTSWDCRPLVARNREEALAHVKTLGRAPDFIVADFRLGGGDTCLQVIEAVRGACGAQMPAVIVTGDTAPGSLHEAQASGLPVLHKPVMPAKLRAVLMRMLPQA